MGRLDRRDRAIFASGRFDELTHAAAIFPAQVKVVADQEKKAVRADEVLRSEDRVAESQRFSLLDEGHLFQMAVHGGFEVMLRAGSDDDTDLLNPCADGFIEKEREHRLSLARATDKCLERKVLLVGAGGRDDGFGDLHKQARRWLISPN